MTSIAVNQYPESRRPEIHDTVAYNEDSIMLSNIWGHVLISTRRTDAAYKAAGEAPTKLLHDAFSSL